jgi:tetrahydromethanopterin S-methyltransferase subunit G
MDKRLDKIEEKLDKIVEIQTNIQVDVAEHIRRTAIAENNIDKLSEALQPINKHVTMVQTVITVTTWTLGIAATIATTYAAFIKS